MKTIFLGACGVLLVGLSYWGIWVGLQNQRGDITEQRLRKYFDLQLRIERLNGEQSQLLEPWKADCAKKNQVLQLNQLGVPGCVTPAKAP